jgi:hypothetical protein
MGKKEEKKNRGMRPRATAACWRILVPILVPGPLLLENLVSQGIEPGPLDLQPGTLTPRPTEAVYFLLHNIYKFRSSLS